MLHDALFGDLDADAQGVRDDIALAGGARRGRTGRGGLRAGARPDCQPRRHLDRRRAGPLGLCRSHPAGDQRRSDRARRDAPRATASRCSTRRPRRRPAQARDAARPRSTRRYAALYFPWVVVANPLARPAATDIPREITPAAVGLRLRHLRPQRHRARRVQGAGERGRARRAALRDATSTSAEQELLNPLGVNCLRFFPGRGYRVWGARTLELGSRVEVRQRAALLHLPRALDRPRHAVGGVRAQRRAAVGQRPRDDRQLPLQRVGSTARCSAPRRRRRSSCAATAAR